MQFGQAAWGGGFIAAVINRVQLLLLMSVIYVVMSAVDRTSEFLEGAACAGG